MGTHDQGWDQFDIDRDGPARLIYESVLRTRPVASTKQAAIDAFRRLFAAPTPPDAPQVVAPPELQTAVERREIRPGDGIDAPPVRLLAYRPAAAETPPPVILYLHGGGWSIGTIDDADLFARVLCRASGAVVVTAEYRLAPEHPYPAALDDSVGAYRWLRAHAGACLDADPARVAVGGDSSGGNLAAALVLRVRDEGGQPPDAALLLCPATDFLFEEHQSFREHAPDGLIYDTAFAACVRAAYARPAEWTHPYVSPARSDLRGFGPALVIAGGADPLVDENRAFVEKLRSAGNDAALRVCDGMPHAFYYYLYYLGLAPRVDEAFAAMGAFLRRTLASAGTEAASGA